MLAFKTLNSPKIISQFDHRFLHFYRKNIGFLFLNISFFVQNCNLRIIIKLEINQLKIDLSEINKLI